MSVSDPSLPLFEYQLNTEKRLLDMIKICEGLYYHSDTILAVVTPKAMVFRLTDCEGFACLQHLMTDGLRIVVKDPLSYSAKILISSLTDILKTIRKDKHTATLYGTRQDPTVLYVREESAVVGYKPINHRVQSTEHRVRLYRILNMEKMTEGCDHESLRWTCPIAEWSRLVNAHVIVAGTNGKTMKWSYMPKEGINKEGKEGSKESGAREHKEPKGGSLVIKSTNEDGMFGHHHIDLVESHSVKLPRQPIESVDILVTFLKRTQLLWNGGSVQIILNKRGLYVKNNHVDLFCGRLNDIDLDAFT